MKIRRVSPDERLSTVFPLGSYAFWPSPLSPDDLEKARRNAPYGRDSTVLVAEDERGPVATVTSIPMRQNVRGAVHQMAGIAGVASHPLARREGHVRTLLIGLLGELRDDGYVLSALYPFRSSFYQRFGYAGLARPRTVTFPVADLATLLRTKLPGEVGWVRVKDGYPDYRSLTEQMLASRHGFAAFPEYRAVGLRDRDEHWLVTARAGGALVGALTYRISGHGGELAGDDLLATGPLGRSLLLQFLARHVDQVAQVRLTVAPDEVPELWATDLTVVSEVRTAIPDAQAPMARVLSVDRLAGMETGPGRVAVTVPDDPFIAGDYLLDGTTGTLAVTRDGAGAGVPAATLTATGLSALVYGVLDPQDVALRGQGEVPAGAAAALRALFPLRLPYLVAEF